MPVTKNDQEADREWACPDSSTTVLEPGTYDLRLCVGVHTFTTARTVVKTAQTIAQLETSLRSGTSGPVMIIGFLLVAQDVVILTRAEYAFLVAQSWATVDGLSGTAWARPSSTPSSFTLKFRLSTAFFIVSVFSRSLAAPFQ